MTRRTWWISGVAVVVAACAVVVAMLLVPRQSHSDCDTVTDIFAYNKQHNELLKSKTNVDAGQEPSISDYQEWATHLHDLAGQVHDPKLTAQTNALAETADKLVDAIKRGRADTTGPPDPNPPTPQWAKDYFALDQQFRGQSSDLHDACPG
jgi:hypothetical protein